LNNELPGYRITQQIGTGAGSKIYLAVEVSSGRQVAVKHVPRETAEDDRFVAQAENEYAVSSKLDHTCLRRSFSIHRLRKRLQLKDLLLVMEYVNGLPLERALPNRLKTFLALFTKVARGLDAMHEAGFLHTDIKPTNILLARGGTVKIIDFGQSCPINHRKERIQGTPDYIAPEQVRRLPLDQRTDVFNLGATMYWVLTSETYPTAIRGPDARGGINVVKSRKPIAPVEHNSKIPLALSALVMECCRDNPAERPADMKQVIARLAVVQRLWMQYREGVRAQLQLAPGSPVNGTSAPAEDEQGSSTAEDDA
jgi:serine/threonine-protein kinase